MRKPMKNVLAPGGLLAVLLALGGACVHEQALGATAAQAPIVTRGPRLQLEPIDVPEADVPLRTAIATGPAQVLRTSALLQDLEQQVAGMRAEDARTRADLVDLREGLEQAQPLRLWATVMQVLAFVVLAGAAGAALARYRTRALPAAREPRDAPVAPQAVIPRSDPQPIEAGAPAPAEMPAVQDGAQTVEPAAAPPCVPGALRIETLAAILDEVDFLRSLGLHAEAMDVLEGYLRDSLAPAPLAYLERMRVCEELDDRLALAAARRRYLQAFGMEAPGPAQLTADTGLDGMDDLCGRITRSWKSDAALQVIEAAIFAAPTPDVPLTLQAGRDLLWLHALARARAGEGAGVVSDDLPLAPWADAEDTEEAQEVARLAAEAEGGHRFALDVDLGAPAPAKDAARDQPPVEAATSASPDEVDAFSAAVATEGFRVSRW